MSISPRLISVGVSAALLASAAPASAAPHSMSCTAAPATSSTATVKNDATGNITLNGMIDLKAGGIRVDRVRGTSAIRIGWHPIAQREQTGPKTLVTWTEPSGQAGLNTIHFNVDNAAIFIGTSISRPECGVGGRLCAPANSAKREYYRGMCRILD